jgi:hypothetical protein
LLKSQINYFEYKKNNDIFLFYNIKIMTIGEKISEKEIIVKELLNELKNILNNSSIYNKKNPTDYKYLSSLSTTIHMIQELNTSLKDINN